jgi:hypothetical protein
VKIIGSESVPRLDADHPEYGVLIPCRNTAKQPDANVKLQPNRPSLAHAAHVSGSVSCDKQRLLPTNTN